MRALIILGVLGLGAGAIVYSRRTNPRGVVDAVTPRPRFATDRLVCTPESLAEASTALGVPIDAEPSFLEIATDRNDEATGVLILDGMGGFRNAFCGALRQGASSDVVFQIVANAHAEQALDPRIDAWWDKFLPAYAASIGEKV